MTNAIEELKVDLNKLERRREKQGGFKRGELKPELIKLSKRHNVSFYTVRNTYYYEVKENKNQEKYSLEVVDGFRGIDKNGEKLYIEEDILDFLELSKKDVKTKYNLKDTDIEKVMLDNDQKVEMISKEVVLKLTRKIKEQEENNTKGELAKKMMDKLGERKGIDESIQEHIQETITEEFKMYDKPKYLYGDIIEVEVMKVLPYGVMVETKDGKGFTGLIHISEVRDWYIDDLNEYFEVGQTLEAKVKLVDKDGRIALSTKGMKLKTRDTNNRGFNSLQEKLTPIKEKMQEQVSNKAEEQVIEDRKDEERVTGGVEKTKDVTEFLPDKETDEIIRFLNNIVGALSPNAKNKLNYLLKEHGIFKFTVTMMEASKGFENDLGMYFLKEVEKKMGEYL